MTRGCVECAQAHKHKQSRLLPQKSEELKLVCQHLVDREAALNRKDLEEAGSQASSPIANPLSLSAANLSVTRDALDEDMSLIELLMRDYKESTLHTHHVCEDP